MGGNDDLIDPQFAPERSCVHGASAAEGYQHKIARVVTAPNGYQLERVHHVGIGQTDHAHGRRVYADAKLGSNRLERVPGLPDVQRDFATEEKVRIDTPGDHMRVGDCWLSPAAPIARRARLCAGAERSDMQRTRLVKPGNGTAAGANLDDVDRRHVDG